MTAKGRWAARAIDRDGRQRDIAIEARNVAQAKREQDERRFEDRQIRERLGIPVR